VLGIDEYYDQSYQALAGSEDEDRLYEQRGAEKVFRTDHLLQTMLAKLSIPEGARVLDYGCAKAGTFRKLADTRPDLEIFLFDVSSHYIPFWSRFTTPEHWATYRPRPEWGSSFDVVTSFFALEHAADPRDFLGEVHALLRPGGHAYLLVPNTYANPSDFVVCDHVSHFSRASLERAFASAGFTRIRIDDATHYSAFTIVAEKAEPDAHEELADHGPVEQIAAQVADLAAFWTNAPLRARAFEQAHARRDAAIYGSGFYGTAIATWLKDLDRVGCFLDQNPFQQAKRILDKPVLAPEYLSGDVHLIYVGLNPNMARSTIAEVSQTCWAGRALEYFFLT
jgi:SAM-dependent methyltransferase